MKLLRCPKGFIGTRVEELDILIDKEPHEERGYTLVDDPIAATLLKRGGYEELSKSAYPRSLELLRAKVRKQLLHPGILTGEPHMSAKPAPISPAVGQGVSEPMRPFNQTYITEPVRARSWWNRLTQLFRTRT